jgi:surface carbohydrate biosynthesis protein
MSLSRPVRPLYFLVEETSRELASRVLLATVAANGGFTSYIAPQWFAWEHFDRMPAGVVLFKGNNGAQAVQMIAARAAGHRVAAIEEEILGVANDRQILRVFHTSSIDVCELFLLQGEHARDILASHFPGIERRIVVTGNPRTNLLLPPFDDETRGPAKAIRRRHGDYILVNTNFGSTNPRVEDTVTDYEGCARIGLITADDPADHEDYIGWCTWERQNMALLANVLAACRSSSTLPKVIVRPHPSENIDKWRQAYPDDEKVSVIREGDHTAWTAGARLLLHTGCTTGVEAMLLGIPTLTLQGGVSDWHRTHTSNLVNKAAGSLEAAMTKIEAFFQGDADVCTSTPQMWRELEHQLLPQTDGTAAQRIIDALTPFAASDPGPLNRGRNINNLSRHAMLASEHKISKADFTPASVAAMAARFAGNLGYPSRPSVVGIGGGMIQVNGLEP